MGKGTELVAATLVFFAAFAAIEASAGTQQCNTACQSRMTDCILSCDGRLSCELACKSQAVACVEACSPPDGGASARPELDAGSPPTRDSGAGDARGRDADAMSLRGSLLDAPKEASPRDR